MVERCLEELLPMKAMEWLSEIGKEPWEGEGFGTNYRTEIQVLIENKVTNELGFCQKDSCDKTSGNDSPKKLTRHLAYMECCISWDRNSDARHYLDK